MANKADLAKMLGDKTGLWQASRQVTDKLPSAFVELLRKDGVIRIKGLGTWKIVSKPPRRFYNPFTGQVEEVPARKTVKFFPSPVLLRKLGLE